MDKIYNLGTDGWRRWLTFSISKLNSEVDSQNLRITSLEAPAVPIEGGASLSITKITTTDGVFDNDGAITGTKEFSVPSDLSAILLLLDGGLERDDFSLDTTAHTITFSGDAPLAVNYIKILYIKS